MNTSFPSTASDFGAFLAGGKQPNTNAQLKGIFAGLGCAKSVAAGSASVAKADFETLLDAPAASANVTTVTAAAGKPVEEIVSNPTEIAPSILTGELSAVVTTTLQIKGMVGGRCHPAPLGLEAAPSEEGVATPNMTSEGEPQPDSPVVDAGSIESTITVATPETAEPVATNPTCPTKEVTAEPGATDTTGPKEEVAPGTAPRQIKLLPGRGHAVRGRGWNPALIQHTGVCGKSPVPAKTESPVVKAALPSVSCSAPATIPAMGVAPDVIVAAIAGIVAPTEVAPVALVTDQQPVDLSVEFSTAADVDRPVAPLLGEQVVIAPAVTGFQIPDAPRAEVVPVAVESDLSNIASTPAVLVSAPTDVTNVAPTRDGLVSASPDLTSMLPKEIAAETPVLPVDVSIEAPVSPVVPSEATMAEVAVKDIFAPVLDRVEEVAEVAPDAAVSTETAPITPELRREVVETVAAMLAPFLLNVPAIQPELVPVASDGLTADAITTGGGNAAVNPTVTITIGAQTPISFELPQAGLVQTDASQTGTDDLAATVPVSENLEGDAPSVRTPDSFILPAVFARLPDEIQQLDFRIQLKARIESAWQEIAQPEAGVAVAVQQIPVIDEILKADVSVVELEAAPVPPSVVSEKVETDETGNPVVAVAAPVADEHEQGSKTETHATPVDVMIKMPGFGVLTAQLMASDKAAGVLLKKPGVGLGRMEKTAGDLKSDGLKDRLENIGFEKTFLTAGTQALKGKEGNAGTDVAISDDTMPARFTSRRVTVDPLEFPPRFNGREIQPIFNQSQNFTVADETPVVATPAPVLAHRAVETILNVVEAQRQSSANASSVNLHFKFGGDDLAVRVQMRGGEVLTQFLTDSAELRSALSAEWQTVAGQGGAAGLRMQDPVIMPTSAGTSNGSGSMAQGQNQARQNAQQHQQEQTASLMPELHALRHRAGVGAPKTEATPRVSFAPSTSQHLTATA